MEEVWITVFFSRRLDGETAEEVYKEILANHPTYLQAHLSLIQNIETSDIIKTQLPFTFKKSIEKQINDSNGGSNNSKVISELILLKKNLQKISDLSSIIIKDTDKDALLAHYGVKADNRPEAAKIKM